MTPDVTLTKSEVASALGKLGKGKKKTLTQEERDRRSIHCRNVNAKRRQDQQEKKLVDAAEVERRIIEEGLTQ